MPIQRTASLPVPADAVAAARKELSPRYGAQVWDASDKRVLLVRVPRAEPDPVNDVEEAVEFLNAKDVEDITHCLLVGDQAVAQVYARPLQELMRERVAFDQRTAASWRERLPGHMAHVLFQAPDDPRRRWRLAVRLPLESVRDLHEEILEDLADGLGAELETPRFDQLAAVYLVAATDDVRLEADMFVQELRSKWQSEERHRREALKLAQREAEKKRQQDHERRQLLREMEQRLGPQIRSRGSTASSQYRVARPLGPAAPVSDLPSSRGPDRHSPSVPAPGTQATGGPSAEDLGASTPGDARGLLAPDVPLAEASATIQARSPAVGSQRVKELRDRVDRVVGQDRAARASSLPTPVQPEIEGEADIAPHAEVADIAAHAEVADAAPNRGELPAAPAVEPLPAVLHGLEGRLHEAGYEILVNPPTPGHTIHLAAERPDGTPQRIVVRAVERLDTDVAKQLLKTARELEVDLVLCVADAVEHEANRLLVATKVTVVVPAQLDQLEI